MQDYSGYGQPPGGPTMPMPPMPPPPRRRVGALSYLLVALAAGALGAGTVVALYHPASNTASVAPQPRASAPAPLPSSAVPQPSSGGSGTSAGEQAIVNKVSPGLVIINTQLQYDSDEAAATGMVISSDGLVLTNNHVIEDSTSITATTANGKTYTAKVVGYDTTGDIALIKLQNASGLRTVPLGDSATTKTGDSVVAMGNAEGQNAIVPAAGQVTALNQTITASDEGGSIASETLHGMIEDNADIVAGDSGGPLANSAGQVIGMDTAGNEGGGFGVQQQSVAGYAIPIDTALAIARQIDAGQASSTITIGYPPFLGVYIAEGSDSSPQAQDQEQQGSGSGYGSFGGNGYGNNGGNGYGNNGGSQGCYTSNRNLTAPASIANVSSGTLILGTICSGPAQAAGMTAGSVITGVNGQAIGSPDTLTGAVSKYHPGDTISVTWVSPSGQRSTSSIKLGSGPPL
jgi:S1-C subfamily serine protease